MAEVKETITALRISARNNYTQRDAQDITVWGTDGEVTQVEVAIGLDTAATEGIERRGNSGTGAGATLMATVDGEGEEPIESMSNKLVAALPAGSVKKLRRFISDHRGDTVWDGRNHVPVCREYCTELLASIRG